MSKEIRWLYEAKSPQEKVDDEENNIATTIAADYLKFSKSKGILERDDAVADALNKVVGSNVGTILKKSLGVGWLTRFMRAFKWDSLQKDNLFIRMLERIFTYSDADLVKKILSGQRPTIKQNESLNEGPDFANVNTTKSAGGVDLTPSAADEYRANREKVNKEQPSQPAQITNDTAKILDMSPSDLFMVLYNGYLDHIYTYEDISLIDNDGSDSVTLKSNNGNTYETSKSMLDIINKCQNNANAFSTKEASSSRSNNDSSPPREVADIIDKLNKLEDNRAIGKDEKDKIRAILNRHPYRG